MTFVNSCAGRSVRKTIGLVAIVSALVAATVAIGIAPTAALPDPDTNCGSQNQAKFHLTFSSSSFWDSTVQGAIQDAFDEWEKAKRPDGDPIVERSSTSSATDVYVDIVPDPNGSTSTNGIGTCSSAVPSGYDALLEINRNLSHTYSAGTWYRRSDLTNFEVVGSHEFGHIFGLTHTGTRDSNWGIMTTCRTAADSPNRRVEKDDEGGLSHKLPDGMNYSGFTANMGFEKNAYFKHWGKTNVVHSKQTSTPPVTGGDAYARILGDRASSRIWQTITFSTSDGQSIRAAGTYRLAESGTSGKGILKMHTRQKRYAALNPNPNFCTGSASRWPSGRNQNATINITPAPAWELLTQTAPSPGTGWANYQTLWKNVDIDSGNHAVQARVTLLPQITLNTNTSVEKPLDVDNLRLED